MILGGVSLCGSAKYLRILPRAGGLGYFCRVKSDGKRTPQSAESLYIEVCAMSVPYFCPETKVPKILRSRSDTLEIFGISLTAVSDHILARPKIWKKRSTLVSEFFEIPTRAVVALFGVLRGISGIFYDRFTNFCALPRQVEAMTTKS